MNIFKLFDKEKKLPDIDKSSYYAEIDAINFKTALERAYLYMDNKIQKGDMVILSMKRKTK